MSEETSFTFLEKANKSSSSSSAISIWTQKSFIDQASYSLSGFRWVGEAANFQCPYCEVGTKSNKKRGYLFLNKMKTRYVFKCHNCNKGRSLQMFLKKNAPVVYDRWILEFVRAKPTTNDEPKPREVFRLSPLLSNKEKLQEVHTLAPYISSLSQEHPARIYLEERQIPRKFFSELRYTENFNRFIKEEYEPNCKLHLPSDERILVEYRAGAGDASFMLQGRSLQAQAELRYIGIRRDETIPKAYGLDRLDRSKPIFVTEGPFDSMFVPNAIAIGGVGLSEELIKTLNLNVKNIHVIYDNQPRNKEVVKQIEAAISLNCKVIIWNSMSESLKDINDMVRAFGRRELLTILPTLTHSGLKATAMLSAWRKV